MSNIILPFMLESSGLRGRVVWFDTVLDDILGPHGYPEPMALLTGEVAILAALLGGMLKYEGIFTLQTQGDGALRMVVSDYTSNGDVRACATLAEGQDIAALSGGSALLGKGYIAFTVDQGKHTERYQGIVELRGSSLLESVQYYFTQSEQIRTGVQLAVGKVNDRWRGAAIMLQDMPDEGGIAVAHESNHVSEENEDWRRAMMLLQTCTKDELLSADIGPHDLLFRLFHEEGVRVFAEKAVQKGCRCSMERVETILGTMSDDDIMHITKDGKITMSCQFCSRDFTFDPAVLGRNMES